MNKIVLVAAIFIAVACGHTKKHQTETHSGEGHLHHVTETGHENDLAHDHNHEHENQKEHGHEGENGHDHEHRQIAEPGVNNEDIKFQYTAYTANFELFAEADPFIVGEQANVLAHFSVLPEFKALEAGKITLVLNVNGREVKNNPEHPSRRGIYSFNIEPVTAGSGKFRFEISAEDGTFVIEVPEVTVYTSHEEAQKAAEEYVVPETNTTVFTKEQSWKTDFSTAHPMVEPFGRVIKTTALVQAAQGNEMVVTAKTNGVVFVDGNTLLEGKEVSAGQVLFALSGAGFAENNFSVRFAEAKNNFEKTKAEFERAEELAKDKIVSEKRLLEAKIQYENAKAVFDNLNKNFSASGQSVKSPLTGFIKQVFVKNGSYVEAGQPVLTVSQNKSLMLTAEVQPRYAPVLHAVVSANVRSLHDNKTYSLEELNGKILSVGQAAHSESFLFPVNFQIDNRGNFTAGSFVEVYLKTLTNNKALTVPNSALLEEQGIYFVWVQVTPELFEKREVKTGNTDGAKTEIISGLTRDERIVTRGAMMIKLSQSTGALDAHSGHVH